MSSSTEARVLRGGTVAEYAGVSMPDLRSGTWTRLGGPGLLGDEPTEQLLGTIAEEARRAAGTQGYSVGWAEGRRAAEAEARSVAEETRREVALAEERRQAEHAAAVAALRSAADQLVSQIGVVCRAVDEQATDLALELTRELVGVVRDDATDHAVRRVVGVLPEHPVVRVRLHPAAVAGAGELRDLGVAIVPDATLGPADAVAEADDHVVDLRLSTALARLTEVLG